MFVVSFSISFRFDLNFAGSFFASARLILPSLILSKRLKALSNFESAVLPLYLYIKSSELTFIYKFIRYFSNFFCFEINGVSSLS